MKMKYTKKSEKYMKKYLELEESEIRELQKTFPKIWVENNPVFSSQFNFLKKSVESKPEISLQKLVLCQANTHRKQEKFAFVSTDKAELSPEAS